MAEPLGYVFKDTDYCPSCLVGELVRLGRLSPNSIAARSGAEFALKSLAEVKYIDRDREGTFSSKDFPKAIRAPSIDCGSCGKALK